jgi:hypothetical protein
VYCAAAKVVHEAPLKGLVGAPSKADFGLSGPLIKSGIEFGQQRIHPAAVLRALCGPFAFFALEFFGIRAIGEPFLPTALLF